MVSQDIGLWSDFLGGLPLVALAALVLSVRPRTRSSISLGLFALGLGSWAILSNGPPIFFPAWGGPAAYVILYPSLLLWIAAIVAFALSFPKPLTRSEAPQLAVPLLVTIAIFAAFVPGMFLLAQGSAHVIWLVLAVLGASALFGSLALIAIRFRASEDADARRSFALTATGLTVYLGLIGGYGWGSGNGVLSATGSIVPAGWAVFLSAIIIGSIWVLAMRGPGARTARNLAWLTFGTVLVGLVLSLGTAYVGIFGVARVLMTAILAYAILRRQLLGVDVKVRWAISKSTLATAFVAVFFITTEAAQQFFGERFESGYLGILAAGGLVFAISPLSRLADRIAATAVRVEASPPLARNTDDEERYRILLRRYLRDGRLSRDEEIALIRAATGMGIAAADALRLRHEIEDEATRA